MFFLGTSSRKQRVKKGLNLHPISPMARAAVTCDGETEVPADYNQGTPILTPRKPRKNRLLDAVYDVESSHLDTVSISSSPSLYSLHTLGENIVEVTCWTANVIYFLMRTNVGSHVPANTEKWALILISC